jgi:excisionase family DNA binding protein
MRSKIFLISEAAKYLGVTPLTLRNWDKKAKIRVFRTPGGHRRFRKSDLDVISRDNEKASDKLQDVIKKIESLDLIKDGREQLDTIVKELKECL